MANSEREQRKSRERLIKGNYDALVRRISSPSEPTVGQDLRIMLATLAAANPLEGEDVLAGYAVGFARTVAGIVLEDPKHPRSWANPQTCAAYVAMQGLPETAQAFLQGEQGSVNDNLILGVAHLMRSLAEGIGSAEASDHFHAGAVYFAKEIYYYRTDLRRLPPP